MACPPRSLSAEDLVAFDVVPSLLAAARTSGLRELRPLQEQAIRAGLLTSPSLATDDLLVVGGAGSGKRSICELASAHHAHSGLRVLLITHDRESAEHCLARLQPYQQIGLRCGLIDLIDRLSDRPRELGQLDLAVAPLETAALLLASGEPVRCGLGLVIIEDLELVADEADSELWPLLLLRCQALKAELPLRMVALCADVALGEKLGQVLHAAVVRDVQVAPTEPDTASLLRARALHQLRGGLLARRLSVPSAQAAIHAVRPR